MYGLMYALAVTAAILIVRRRWRNARRRSRTRLRRRDLGLPGRAARRPPLLRHHQLQRNAPHLVRPDRGLGRRARDLGRDRRRAPRSASGASTGRASRSPPSWTAPPPPCSSPRRSAGSATTSTRSSSAARPRCPGASRSHPPTAPRATSTTPPSSRPSSTRSSGTSPWPPSSSGSATTARSSPPGLFALYVAGYSAFRIFEESLRVDPAHHILGQRLNFWVAIVLTLVGVAWFVWTQRRSPEPTIRRSSTRSSDAREPVDPRDDLTLTRPRIWASLGVGRREMR